MTRFCIILLLLMLTACQTRPALETGNTALYDSAWSRDVSKFRHDSAGVLQAHQTLINWRYSAKVGIRTPTVREQANLVWQFAEQSNHVRLFGPLGMGAVKIDFDDNGVVLSDGNSELHRGNNAETLLTNIVGWPIPVDALSHWLFALPLPGQTFAYQRNEAGHVSELSQLDWQLSYSAYREYALTGSEQILRLPRKITATRVSENGTTIVIKLVTKNWQL